MFTDMVGYTALGQRNESLSLALVEEQRKLVRPILTRHNGREIKTMGDAFLVEFPNALDAVRCAYDIQRATREFNISLPQEKRVHLKVGLHLGDVVESKGDISGDAVNVASRIEPLAEDGGVCLTRQVYDHVSNKFELPLTTLGAKVLKNVTEPVEVFKVVMPWEQTTTVERPTFATNRIAILPFRNMSPDPNDEYFAEGITEEIISTVSGISGIEVISRTSVMGYKGTTKRIEEIGRELMVGSVLEGSLRKAGNRIRVSTQLVEVARDKHLWAQNYDRNLDDVFEVQSDIAKQVADALRVKILSEELERIDRKPTENIDAYTLYLKGRQIWNRRGMDDMKKAAACFEQSVEKDPDFALGYAGQADCFLLLAGNWREDIEHNLEKARMLVAKALELDPALAEAHATRGLILQWYDVKLREADEEFRKSVELKPSYATAHQWYASLLLDFGRFEDAFLEIKRAIELDPLSEPIMSNYANYFHFTRENEKWLAAANRLIEAHPEQSWGYIHRTWAEAWLGRPDEARQDLETYIRLSKDDRSRPGLEALLEALLGNERRARELIAIAYQRADVPSLEALWNVFGLLGDKEGFFTWVDFAIKRRAITAGSLRYDPCLDNVRGDSRFKNLLRQFNLEE